MFRAPLRAVKVYATPRTYRSSVPQQLYTLKSRKIDFTVAPTVTFKGVIERMSIMTTDAYYFKSSVDHCTYEFNLTTMTYTKISDNRVNVRNVHDVYNVRLRDRGFHGWTVVELATGNNFNMFALGGDHVVPNPLITTFHYFGRNVCVADTMDHGAVILDSRANILFKHENPVKTYEYGGMLNGTHLFHENDITLGVQIRK